MKLILLNSLLCLITIISVAQETQEVPETVIKSTRIDLPFSQNSHTISIINAEEIKNSTAQNVADLLQQIPGIDVRRRGTDGMQSDLYIRGGNFNQTLLLIDGIKADDAQTGHHTMNMIIPFENIERIEVIKGPAARIFGQNAFGGAINIVTKNTLEDQMNLQLGTGSYGRFNGEIGGALNIKNTTHQFQYARNSSKGYRFNTDYNNDNFFLKSTFNTKKAAINLIGIFNQRKFGANGFYASPAFVDQYEETQTSLIGVSSEHKIKKLTIKPRIYWRRNQDNYFFLRQNPSFFENFHISNKIGAEINANYRSKLGISGFGLELAQTYLSSNNLGKRQRTAVNLFVEHRMTFFKDKLDITPGVAVNYITDFKFHAFPGIDLGYKINKHFKLYGNVGYTYRIPTYTELYYASPTTLGNKNLKPERAFAQELGANFKNKFVYVNLVGFHREAFDLIDYTKAVETDIFTANNIRKVNTLGLESNVNFGFKFLKQQQNFNLGYTFMKDIIKGLDVPFSRYALNSTKHQFTANFDFALIKGVRTNVAYRFIERADGTTYNVWDAKMMFQIKSFEISAIMNNIYDIQYTETNLVPMPGRNIMLNLKYTLK